MLVRRLLSALMLLLCSCVPAFARQKVLFWCEQGGVTVQIPGTQGSTTKFQQSFPGCTVTVYATGTTNTINIFSDNAGTAKANPFTTSATTAQGFFYADNGRVDMKFTGTGLTTFTLSDILLNDSAQFTTTLNALAYSATPTFDASLYSLFTMTLTGNVTSSTITNSVTGQIIGFNLCQDSTGARTFSWPASFLRPPVIASGPSQCTNPTFFYDGTNWRPLAATGDNTQLRIANGIRYADQFASVQAAMTDAGPGGTVYVGCGTFTGPTTWYSGQTLKSTCPRPFGIYVTTYGSGGGGFQNATNGTVFQYGAGGLTLTNLNNMTVEGIALDFQQLGGSLVLNSTVGNTFRNLSLFQCGNTTVGTGACLQMIVGGTTATFNNLKNTFYDTYINPTQASGAVYADCRSMVGQGGIATGGIVTLNTFYNTTCAGNIGNGYVYRLNSDSNYDYGIQFNNTGSAHGYAVVINDVTPATDQDACNGCLILFGSTQGSFTGNLSVGQTIGPVLQLVTGNSSLNINVLGGTPDCTITPLSLTAGQNAGSMFTCGPLKQQSITGVFQWKNAGQANILQLTNNGTSAFWGLAGASNFFTWNLSAPSGSDVMDSSGNRTLIGTINATRLISTIANGTAPIQVTSATPVPTLTVKNCDTCVISTSIAPNGVNAIDLGTAAFAWRKLYLGTGATNNFVFTPAATAAARTVAIADPLGNVNLPFTIVSGTKALNTSSVTTATCDSGAAATATGTLSTDVVDWSFNAAPTASNKYGAFLVVHAVPSADTVTFYTCNPSATTSTPTAMTVNWSVRRP